MEPHELNELVRKFNFPLEKIESLADKYPSAKFVFVEQVLSYVKNHGMTFSYVMNMMEMDAEFLRFLGISNAEGYPEQVLSETSRV